MIEFLSIVRRFFKAYKVVEIEEETERKCKSFMIEFGNAQINPESAHNEYTVSFEITILDERKDIEFGLARSLVKHVTSYELSGLSIAEITPSTMQLIKENSIYKTKIEGTLNFFESKE